MSPSKADRRPTGWKPSRDRKEIAKAVGAVVGVVLFTVAAIALLDKTVATQVSTTPTSSTLPGLNPPVTSTPITSTPTGSTPITSTPITSTPAGSTPTAPATTPTTPQLSSP